MHITNMPVRATLFFIFIIIWLALILFGGLGNVLVHESIYLNLVMTGGIATIFIYILLINGLFNKESIIRKAIRTTGYSRWVTCLAIVFVTPLITVYPIAKGIPTVAHFVLPSEEVILTFTVSKKNDLYISRGCSGKVYLIEYSLLSNDFVCGFYKKDWVNLKPGDKIKLVGKKSSYGFRYASYKS